MRRPFFLAVALVLCVAPTGWSDLHDIGIDAVVTDQGLVNHLKLDFDGRYAGSQLLLRLDQGSIYQHELGGTAPPHQALIDIFPALAQDTFVAQGGTTLETTIGEISVGGGAVGLGGDASAQFDTQGINQAWNPAPVDDVVDQTDFLVAQITLSPDAVGSFGYLVAIQSNNPISHFEGWIADGRMNLVPEPCSARLIILALVNCLTWRRRR